MMFLRLLLLPLIALPTLSGCAYDDRDYRYPRGNRWEEERDDDRRRERREYREDRYWEGERWDRD